jgi:hypothetical protein
VLTSASEISSTACGDRFAVLAHCPSWSLGRSFRGHLAVSCVAIQSQVFGAAQLAGLVGTL